MSSGGKGGKAAKTPDYSALAIQQAELNKQAAMDLTALNRPNQVDAFGNSITWSQNFSPEQQALVDRYQNELDQYNAAAAANTWWAPDLIVKDRAAIQKKLDDAKSAGTWTQQQSLNPEQKAIWDKYISDSGKAMSSYGDLLNNYLSKYSNTEFGGGPQTGEFQVGDQMGQFSSTAGPVKGYSDAEFNGDNVANALYESIMGRARPEQERNTAALDTQLRQQGLIPGTEAYNRSMQNLLTSQNDANLLASQNAVLAGANEGRNKYASYLAGQGQQFGQDLSGYNANLAQNSQNFGQNLSAFQTNMAANQQNYQQGLNTYLTNRNQGLQELAGLAGLAGGSPYQPTYPGFSAATGYQPADLLGAAQATQAANQQRANSSNSKKGGLLSAGTSLGGAYLGSK